MAWEFPINVLSETEKSAELRGKCLVSERGIIKLLLTGGMRMVGGELEPQAPAAYPYNVSGGLNLVVKGVKVSPVGETWGSPAYCYLDVSYGPPKPEEETSADPMDLFQVSIQIAAEGLKLPEEGLVWGSGASNSDIQGNPLEEGEDTAPMLWIPTVEISFKNERLKKLKSLTIAQKASHTNSAVFTIPNDDTFPIDCVLFVGCSGEQKRTEEGYKYASRDLKFHARAVSWNKQWCPKTGQFEPIQCADGSPLYAQTSFADLFTG